METNSHRETISAEKSKRRFFRHSSKFRQCNRGTLFIHQESRMNFQPRRGGRGVCLCVFVCLCVCLCVCDEKRVPTGASSPFSTGSSAACVKREDTKTKQNRGRQKFFVFKNNNEKDGEDTIDNILLPLRHERSLASAPNCS